jgi:hypothetical protein
MKKIKVEINKLLKILADMKKHYNDYTRMQLNKYYGKLVNDFTIYIDNETKDNVPLREEIYKTIVNSKNNNEEDMTIALSNDTLLQLFLINFVKEYQSIQNVVINLNKLLDKPIKKVQSLEEMQHKKMLSIKEVESLYGVSKTQQQGFRGRLRNPLPYHKQSTKSKSANTKVYYKRNELEEWMENFL